MKGKGLGVWSTEAPLPSPPRDHMFMHTEWKCNLNQATDEAWSSYWIWFFSWGQNKCISLSPGLTQFCRSVIWQALPTTRWNKIMPSRTQTSVRWYAGLKLGYLLMRHLASHCYWVSGQMASLWPLLEEYLPTNDPPNTTSYNLTFLLPGSILSCTSSMASPLHQWPLTAKQSDFFERWGSPSILRHKDNLSSCQSSFWPSCNVGLKKYFLREDFYLFNFVAAECFSLSNLQKKKTHTLEQ